MEESTVRRPTGTARAADDANPVVIVLSGGSLGKTYRLEEGEQLIGRSLDASVRLDEEGVSRRHAMLLMGRDGKMTIRDLDSTNGTYVNGVGVKEHGLEDGDHIQLGPVAVLKFTFQDEIEEQFQQKLYESATRDALTSTYNKRYFMEQLEKDYAHAIRHSAPLSMLVLDLDHFKQINDTYGHPAGDYVLQTLGIAMATAVRKEDVLCRIGGEEFAVIMRDCDEPCAIGLAERLRRLAEKTTFKYGEQALNVRLSAGVSTLDPARHKSPDSLLNEADQFLYEAKRSGRNRICSPTLRR